MKKKSVRATGAKKKPLSVASIIGMQMGAETTNYRRLIKNAESESARKALMKAEAVYLSRKREEAIDKRIGTLNIEIQKANAELEALKQLKVKPTIVK